MKNAIAVILLSIFAVASANAATQPYDESADAKAEIQATLADARNSQLPVLIVFGANWCADCKVLDMAFKSGASASLIRNNFRVVKVDVGRFDKNTDIAKTYGLPLKSGIPAVVVLSPQGKLIHATRAGELADARNMGDTAIFEFFNRVANSKH